MYIFLKIVFFILIVSLTSCTKYPEIQSPTIITPREIQSPTIIAPHERLSNIPPYVSPQKTKPTYKFKPGDKVKTPYGCKQGQIRGVDC